MDQKTDDSGMAVLKMQPGGSAKLFQPKSDQEKKGAGEEDQPDPVDPPKSPPKEIEPAASVQTSPAQDADAVASPTGPKDTSKESAIRETEESQEKHDNDAEAPHGE